MNLSCLCLLQYGILSHNISSFRTQHICSKITSKWHWTILQWKKNWMHWLLYPCLWKIKLSQFYQKLFGSRFELRVDYFILLSILPASSYLRFGLSNRPSTARYKWTPNLILEKCGDLLPTRDLKHPWGINAFAS